MKKTILAALALLLLPFAAAAQSTAYATKSTTLMQAYDLDAEAANAAKIVALADAADSTTYTIAAQPDVCRLVDITVTDANSTISAGQVTVTGTGCLGNPLVSVFTITGGSGVKTGSPGAYFASVTSVISGVLTGEEAGTDKITVGYSTGSNNTWAMYGVLQPRGPNGEWGVDPWGSIPVPLPITTSGSSSTTVTSVSSNAAFTNVIAGDLLVFNLKGVKYERKVTARASADSITVDSAINIPAAGTTFSYKRLYASPDPSQIVDIPVEGWSSVMFIWSVDANANTGGVVELTQCTVRGPEFPSGVWVQVDTATVTSGSTQAPTAIAVDLFAKPYTHCRFGIKFGTNDDADAAPEDINVQVALVK